MSYTTTLELVTTNGHEGQSHSVLAPPCKLPTSYSGANLVLNHGLLIGEMLGIPIHKAQRIIDRVYEQADIAPYINRSDQQWLFMTFTAISRILCHATSRDGIPAQNRYGKILTESDLLETQKNGSLIIKYRQLHLGDLQRSLSELNEFLSFAIGNDLIIKMQ